MRSKICFIVFLLSIIFLSCASEVAEPIIVEFCPDTYLSDEPDEYFVLALKDPLTQYSITDGEGTLTFPVGASMQGKSTVTIAYEGARFFEVHGYYPDFEVKGSSYVPDMVQKGTFRLANKGDEITVLSGNQVLDTVQWPGDVTRREGQVHYRDVDGTWDPRILMLGGTRLSSASFSSVSGVAFVSPDSSRAELLRAITEAKKSLLLNAYEISDQEVAEALCTAHTNGVSVRVLVEGGPVGGISSEGHSVLNRLNQCGTEVKQVGGGQVHSPYRFNHAKYLTVDNRCVLVTSENIGVHGFPELGTNGNRGWGVYLCHSKLASYMSEIFLEDFTNPASVPIIPSYRQTPPQASEKNDEVRTYHPVFLRFSFMGAEVIPVVAPDTSYELVSLIDRATKTIDIEQAYISQTKGEWTELMHHVFDAARRGVSIRILLDSYWFNVVGTSDNDEIVDQIRRIAYDEGLSLEAKLVDLRATNLMKIHNKGVIVDGSEVFVSSINWNENSPSFNREVGMIIKSTEVAGYFTEVFESDWNPRSQSLSLSLDLAEVPNSRGIDMLRLFGLLVVGFILLIVYFRRHHR
ncbi:MAG: phospholipase D-like domain-containing protein [Methanomicrobiales archaeon]|nr:phospholipase D-like domain-containing protein [Methanomicrobiales archaeon]